MPLHEIFSSPSEESLSPVFLSEGAHPIPLQAGEQLFKFEVEPGFHYSFIVNTGSVDHHLMSRGAPAVEIWNYSGMRFQAESYGFSLPDNGITNNFSPGKSAILFFADPGHFPRKYFNYVRVFLWESVSTAWIKIVKKKVKHFCLPFSGNQSYLNAFGYRAILPGRMKPTINGHDGVDIKAFSVNEDGSPERDLDRPVHAIAHGKVIKTKDLGILGKAVWIEHNCGEQIFTSLSVHLQELFVKTGDRVLRGKTEIGTIFWREAHLHLEIFPKSSTAWWKGYSYGRGGQVDPLGIIFEN